MDSVQHKTEKAPLSLPALSPFTERPARMAARPYACPLCQYTAKTSSDLGKHRSRHSGARDFPCDAPGCGRAFLAALDLARHRRTHLGALACPHACGYTATTRLSLNGHVKQCPAGAGRPPPSLVCGLNGCTFSSPRACSVQSHQRSMHDPAKGNALACRRCEFITESHKELLAHVRQHNFRAQAVARAAATAAAAVVADELAGREE